jgi:hypothetical protein
MIYRRFDGMELELGADAEILLETISVHARSVVPDLDAVMRDCYFYQGRISIIGIVHDLAYELNALGIETLADGDNMALVNRNGYKLPSVFHRLLLYQSGAGRDDVTGDF